MSGARWNVDKYRTEFECDEHWELRRKFLIAHHNKFSEDELVCLAQTFTNIEFLGCRYPQKTMEKVAFLAQGIVEEYREKQKGRLQRTFVTASDAAGAKMKGLKRPQTDATLSPVPEKQLRHSEKQYLPAVMDLTHNSPVKPREKSPPPYSRYGGVRTYHITSEPVKQKLELTANKYGKLLIIECDKMNPVNIIKRSVETCNVSHSFQTEMISPKIVKVKLIVNNILVSEYLDTTEKAAREGASRLGLKKLKESCYTILVKHKFLSDTAVDISLFPQPENNLRTVMADTETPDDNVGNKRQCMIGWTGKGVGRIAQGITESNNMRWETVQEIGFGSRRSTDLSIRQFRRKVTNLLRDFANRETDYDLIFTNDFTNEERKLLHQLGHMHKLKTKTYGKEEEDRYIVVSKKIPIWDEANKLLATGGSSAKYELIPPCGML